MGNITHIADQAMKTITYNNQQVKPDSVFEYDPVYRLISAQGREHIGRIAFDRNPTNNQYRDYPFLGIRTQVTDLQAIQTYTEQYEYDEVGNFQEMRHLAANNPWTQGYAYLEKSLIETTRTSNRLSRTSLPGNDPLRPELFSARYLHDEHGCMTKMLHLQLMEWDYKDQLQHVRQGTMNAYYVYDASGQRVQKVVEKNNGTLVEERLYLGGFEVFRARNGVGGPIALERETLHTMDDKQRVALIETKTVDVSVLVTTLPVTGTRYQFGNHLGSASLELDEQADIISYEEYQPYGTSSYQAGRSAAEVSLKRYRYTAMEKDEESGLDHHPGKVLRIVAWKVDGYPPHGHR